jgi:predicted ribosome quality control (RQC) complex YloA/Tae2 family protein
MKDSMSNVDIRLILPELRESAEGAFIKNVYQNGDIFVLKLYQPGGGTSQLLIHPGHRIHLTEFARKASRTPPKFCSVLRKYLRDKRISAVKQHELDRIIVFEVGDEENSYKLVAELFGNGNLLLLDPKDTIFVAMRYRRMRDRDIIPKATYEFPPPRGADVLTLESDSLQDIIADSNANIVRTLASRLNLDSLSCEEICALSKVSPKVMSSDIDGQTLSDLQTGLAVFVERLKTGVKEPNIVLDDEPVEEEEPEFIAFLPFRFELYQELPIETFDTFSQAIDEFSGVSESELEDEQEQDALSREQKRLQRIIDKQNESIEKLMTKAKVLRANGELIYSRFTIVQEVLETVTKARSGGTQWEEIIAKIEQGKEQGIPSAKLIQRVIPSQGQIIVKLNDTEVTLDIRLSAQDNASLAYDKAKKAESKVEGAKKQIVKTKEKLEKVEVKVAEPDVKRVPVKTRKKRWYEKFRWFISSEGFLVLGGRDAKSNENLAKRQMGANDVFLHAAIHGAPYTVIKVPDKPPGQTTLEEAAQFAVTFSRAWQDGLSSGDAYWVNPEQVSFSPPSGEYLPTGAVMLYGSKNYIRRMSVELAVGVILEEEYAIPISGPPSAVTTQTEFYVQVMPGDMKKGQLVKEVLNRLKGLVPDESADLVSQIPQEDMMRVLPTGGGEITL